MDEIIKTLIKAAKARKISQKDLAIYIGQTPEGFARSAKDNNIKMKDFLTLCDYIGVDPKSILNMDERFVDPGRKAFKDADSMLREVLLTVKRIEKIVQANE